MTDAQTVSFWRPIPPMRNYKPLGDVVVLGSAPPDVPVAVYRNDAALHDVRATHTAPVFAPPVSYRLVWRAVTTNPVVVWKPEAPEGYVALGCLVSSTMAYPAPDAVLCVRADRVGPAPLAKQAVWSYNPQQFLLESAIPCTC